MKTRAKMIINIIVLFLFILSLILMIIINGKENIVSFKAWNVVLSALSLVFAVYLLLHHFYALIIRSIVLVYNKIIKYIIVNLSNKCVNFGNQLKAKLNTENEEYHHLAPTYLEKSEYVRILKSQVDNPKIKNIAISGPYGSGKSSVLHTFKISYPQYKCLNLSLAAFALKELIIEEDVNKENPNNENTIAKITQKVTRTKDTIKYGTKCKGMEELEYSLVQQFFYHVKAKDIPYSRFGRIHRWSWFNKTKVTVFIISFFICSIYLIQPDWVKNIPIFKDTDFFENTFLQYICMFIYGGILFYATYKLISFIHKFNGGRVRLMNYEIELQKDIKTSVFNRYLDELVYLFQTTKYEIVILEDLDRFENTNIFARLRELNTLLNQSKDIGRRIVFIYALSDSVFEKSIERTKFFDFILPIIPHTNPSNSADQFVNILGKLVNGEDESKDITKNFIKDIAPFICDLRTIKAISTEYKICSSLLDKKLSQQNLLAMVIYKNLYPKDFELIYKGEGKIIEAFKNKPNFIIKKLESVNIEIEELKNKISQLNEEHLQSLKELKLIIIGAISKCIPNNYKLCDLSGKYITMDSLFSDNNLQTFFYSGVGYKNDFSHITKIQLDKIKEIIGEDFDYLSRKNILDLKSKNKYKRLMDELNHHEQYQSDIEKMSMQQLCSIDETLVPVHGNDEECSFLNFLIRRGYIDEKYYNYITVSTEGILTKNDNDYLLSIKCNTEWSISEMLHSFESPELMLDYLIPQDYLNDRILNIYIVNAISKCAEEKCREFLINKLSKGGPNVLEFIKYYLLHTNLDITIINGVIKKYNTLWIDIEDYSAITKDEMLFLFGRMLIIGDIEDLINLDIDGRFSNYLSQSSYHMYLDLGLSQEKLMNLISKLNIKVRHIIKESQYQDFAEFLYNGNHYELNKYNILFILERFGKVDLILYKNAIYTAVLEAKLEPLITLIDEDIESFVQECILSNGNDAELEQTVVLLLNNEDISLALKNSIIEHNETIIENVEMINNNDLRNKLYTLNRVKPTLLNITCYLGYNDLDEIDSTLLEFINSNSRSIINCIKNSEENEIAIEALLKKEGVDDTIWQEIFNNPFYDKKFKSSLPYLRKEQFIFYVNTEEKADFILEHLKVADIDLMRKILTLSKNKILKMKALACYLDEYAELEISCINDLLVAMGEEFAILTTNKGQNFEIKRTPEAELFIEQLIKRDIISRNGGTRAKIKVVVK